jgi:transcriptional regulator with XRE-family HTH domain
MTALEYSAGESDFRGLLLRHRGRTGLTQAELAAQTGVHTRSLQGWESGLSVPSTRPLQALLACLLGAGGFTVGQEVAEAEAMCSAVQRESSRQYAPFDRGWFTSAVRTRGAQPRQPIVATPPPPSNVAEAPNDIVLRPAADWGDAPERPMFVGRQDELGMLHESIVRAHTRLLVISGIGGIGKSTFAARLCRDIASQFQRVYWRSLRSALPFSDWASGAIDALSDVQQTPSVDDASRQETLIEILRQRRCLLVLDNIENLLQPGRLDGSFHPECGGYAAFFRSIGESRHQSCVLLTSREVPSALLHTGLHVFELGGFQLDDAKILLNDAGLVGDDVVWTELVTRYGGNALALRLVADTIRELFGGDIAEFIEQVPPRTIFGGLRRLFESQLDRVSLHEMQVVHVLATAREPVSFAALSALLDGRTRRSTVLEAVETLRNRSLIERVGSGYGLRLQSVLMDYVHEQLSVELATVAA